jgi:hypothetical protein
VSYSYRAYGLGIDSSHPIPGLENTSSLNGSATICLEQSPEPPSWADAFLTLPSKVRYRRQELEASADSGFVLTVFGDEHGFELAYSDGARFLVDGRAERVWGKYLSPLTAEDLATYFLGPVMGFLLRRRHITSLHASAVEIAGNAVCLCGDAGRGKSTTAAALALRGRPVLAEDIVALREANGKFWGAPGYPRVCLWPESARMLLGSEETLPFLTPVWEKRYLDLDGKLAQFSHQDIPVGVAYLFAERSNAPAAPHVEAINPREALLELVQNTYMNWLIERDQRAVEFDVLSRLVKSVPVRRIVPHSDPAKLTALCEVIERDATATFADRK